MLRRGKFGGPHGVHLRLCDRFAGAREFGFGTGHGFGDLIGFGLLAGGNVRELSGGGLSLGSFAGRVLGIGLGFGHGSFLVGGRFGGLFGGGLGGGGRLLGLGDGGFFFGGGRGGLVGGGFQFGGMRGGTGGGLLVGGGGGFRGLHGGLQFVNPMLLGCIAGSFFSLGLLVGGFLISDFLVSGFFRNVGIAGIGSGGGRGEHCQTQERNHTAHGFHRETPKKRTEGGNSQAGAFRVNARLRRENWRRPHSGISAEEMQENSRGKTRSSKSEIRNPKSEITSGPLADCACQWHTGHFAASAAFTS